MRFTKMQGLGNDYLYIYCADPAGLPEAPEQLAVRMSDEHFGAGADGIVLVMPGRETDFAMRIFNRDGSEAEMCGNAIRCIGKYVYDKGLTRKTEITVATGGGVKRVQMTCEDGRMISARVDMGCPVFGNPNARLSIPAGDFTACLVSMGNPHAVIFTPDPDAVPLNAWGPLLERHSMFPNRCNIEFASVEDRTLLRVRVWERGSGITLACGTGACAVFAAAYRKGLCASRTRVRLPGGELTLEWDGETGHVFQEGPAAFVYEGEWIG